MGWLADFFGSAWANIQKWFGEQKELRREEAEYARQMNREIRQAANVEYYKQKKKEKIKQAKAKAKGGGTSFLGALVDTKPNAKPIKPISLFDPPKKGKHKSIGEFL